MRNRKDPGVALRAGMAVVLAFAGAGIARADDSREAQLEQRVRDLEKQLTQVKEDLRGGYFTANSDLEARVSELERSADDGSNSMSAQFKNGWKNSTADGAFQYQVKGRVQNDWVWYWDNGNDSIRSGTSSFGAPSSETNPEFGFRRIYLGVDGMYYGNVKWSVNLDFVNNDVQLREVYMEIINCNFGAIRVGHMKEPFGLDTLTSDLFTTFLERNAIHRAFSPNYNTGFMIHGRAFDDMLLYQGGVFRDANSAGNDFANQKDGEYNITARLSGRPMVQDDGTTWLHLGLSGSHRDFAGSQDSNDPLFIPAGSAIPFGTTFGGAGFTADDGWLWGLEAAYVTGPMTFKGEYAQAHGDFHGGAGATFDAWSLEAGYWLTGENTPYDKENGSFGRTAPKHNYGDGDGVGAWQLAARVDSMDLEDEDVDGEDLDTWTFGVNWWLNPNTRIAINFIHEDYDNLDEKINALAFRFQWDF